MKPVFRSSPTLNNSLFPFAVVRPAFDIRIGILTLRQKWEMLFGINITAEEGNAGSDRTVPIPANAIPSESLISAFMQTGSLPVIEDTHYRLLQHPWQIFQWNDWAIRLDFLLLTHRRRSEAIPASVTSMQPENIFIEPGAKLRGCVINAEGGPVYIARNTEIMEGALIRGPFALCEGAVVKMGSRIYGATTVGPYSTIGGEVKNSVIFGYSNKSHDGYLGDSVLAEWCNLGAGTSNSNLKNTAGDIRIWNAVSQSLDSAGITKCGVLMGDYSRAAINTSFNTGTVAGICANIFGSGLTPKYIPSFSWGMDPFQRYAFDKAIKDIANWKKLKGHHLADGEERQLRLIFDEN